jgi:hypothetical protein
MKPTLLPVIAALALTPLAATADGELEAAKKAVTDYLVAVKDAAPKQPTYDKKGKLAPVGKVDPKKYEAAKKLTAPKTLDDLAALQKRTKDQKHSMAPWAWAQKDHFIIGYDLGEARQAPKGAVVVTSKEKYFRVEEGGVDGEPEGDAYLVGPVKGKWLIVDKKTNGDFTDDAIKIGYKGYWDETAAPPKPEPEPEEKEEGEKKE